MKQLMMLMLSLTMLVSACNNAASTDNKDGKPEVEVKINKAEEAKKKIKEARERGRATTEGATTEETLNTDKYNSARDCLLNGATADCSGIENSEEYSKAWNNLTSEGYLCQNGRCYSPEEQQTTEAPADIQSTEESTEEVSTEVQSTEGPATDIVTEAPQVQY